MYLSILSYRYLIVTPIYIYTTILKVSVSVHTLPPPARPLSVVSARLVHTGPSMPHSNPSLTLTMRAPSFHAPSQAIVSNNIVRSFLSRHHAPSSPHALFSNIDCTPTRPTSPQRRCSFHPRDSRLPAPSPSMPRVLNVGRSTDGNLRTGCSGTAARLRRSGRGMR